jgi:hypothetical protein
MLQANEQKPAREQSQSRRRTFAIKFQCPSLTDAYPPPPKQSRYEFAVTDYPNKKVSQ